MKILKFFFTKDFALIAFCIILQVTIILPFVQDLAEEKTTRKFQKELIEKGFAEYDSQTGVWKYKTQILSAPKVHTPKVTEDFSDLDALAVVPDHFPTPKKPK